MTMLGVTWLIAPISIIYEFLATKVDEQKTLPVKLLIKSHISFKNKSIIYGVDYLLR